MDSTRNLKYSIRLLPPDRQKRKRQSHAAFFLPGLKGILCMILLGAAELYLMFYVMPL